MDGRQDAEPRLEDYIDEFMDALRAQLGYDYNRWGDTWRHRPQEGQEERTIAKLNDYFDQYLHADQPINWLAVTGNAFICWLREMHPELSLID